ncbi:hypothetical protein SUGI_0447340 [Cryptomeria japonica]|nr:hypothetical protein SUGI_0447340 [Cryptomeria japonica]
MGPKHFWPDRGFNFLHKLDGSSLRIIFICKDCPPKHEQAKARRNIDTSTQCGCFCKTREPLKCQLPQLPDTLFRSPGLFLLFYRSL